MAWVPDFRAIITAVTVNDDPRHWVPWLACLVLGHDHVSSSCFGIQCQRQGISPFSLGGPSFLISTRAPSASRARSKVLLDIPFSLAASCMSFAPIGPLLSSVSIKRLALSRALGDLFSV